MVSSRRRRGCPPPICPWQRRTEIAMWRLIDETEDNQAQPSSWFEPRIFPRGGRQSGGGHGQGDKARDGLAARTGDEGAQGFEGSSRKASEDEPIAARPYPRSSE